MGADAAMNRPAGRNDRLFVVHYYVAGFVGLAHKLDNRLLLGQLEVHINFHSSLVSVAGKRIPCAALDQLGHAHCKLTALAYVADYELVNRPFVDTLARAEVTLYTHLCACGNAVGGLYYFNRGISLVGGAGINVELRGVF